MTRRLAVYADPLPLHHPLRGRSPSPSELGEDLEDPPPVNDLHPPPPSLGSRA